MELEVYAVRNSDGYFFRAKGYGGYGDTWVDDIKKAKIYTRIGQARSRITWFANNYPAYPAPDLIKFTLSNMEVIDETARVKKANEDKIRREAKAKEREAKRKLQYAQERVELAQKEVERLTRGT